MLPRMIHEFTMSGGARRACVASLVVAVAVAVCGLITSGAKASDAGDAPPPPPPPPASHFDKGTFCVSLTGGYYSDVESPNERVNPYTLGANYYVRDDLALGVEVSGYVLDAKDGFDDAGAAGANLTLRHHIFERGDFSTFLEVALGMIYADDEFPPGGTRFNFTEQFGVGVTYRLRDNVFVVGGGRFIHISNAYIHGRDQNPGVNALGGYVGLMLTF
jgi:hypothetical protein